MASEPSGPIGRLKHDHIDLDAEERRHRRDKKGSPPVMAIILGLTILTAIVFYVLHVRAVAKETAEAERRARSSGSSPTASNSASDCTSDCASDCASASFCDGTNNCANDCASRCDCEAAHHWDRRQSGLKSG
jgi:hypothetical protein